LKANKNEKIITRGNFLAAYISVPFI